MNPCHFLTLSRLIIFSSLICGVSLHAQSPSPNGSPNDIEATETIVFVRHGEKPPTEHGQLNCQGLNRSLALPKMLIDRYGKAAFIFAPDPEKNRISGNDVEYPYIRALATIEPTAVTLALPVETKFGYREIDALQRELLEPKYQRSLIFVAWEHLKLNMLVKNLLGAFGEDPAKVPEWKNDDFDSIYVITLRGATRRRSIQFQHDFEGLRDLSMECLN